MLGFLLRWLVVSIPTGLILGKLLKATQTPPPEPDERRAPERRRSEEFHR